MTWYLSSDADMADESISPQTTQEAMLTIPRGQLNPQGGPMIWDPVSRSYVPQTDPSQDDKPNREQVPGTPRTPSIDFQDKTKNPQFSGPVFSAVDVDTDYRQVSQHFMELAQRESNPSRKSVLLRKSEYYRQLAERMQPEAADPAATQADLHHDDQTDTYQDKTPKPTLLEKDDNFPSMISRHTNGVTSNMLYKSERNSYQDPATPNLRDCPEEGCGGKMMDQMDESHCHDCGHREKVYYASLMGDVGMGAGLGMALDVVAPEVGIPLQAAGLMSRVMGGGSGSEGQPAQSGGQEAGGSPAADDDEAELGEREAAYAGLPIEWVRRLADISNSDDMGYGYDNTGYDSEVHSGDKGTENQDTANPELLGDVDDEGGTQGVHVMDLFDIVRPHLESLEDGAGKDDPIAKLMHELMEAEEPGYMDKAASVKTATASCMVCGVDLAVATVCGDPSPQMKCPNGLPKAQGGATQPMVVGQQPATPGSFGQPMSSTHGWEVEAARRPKMCPVHTTLVDYALTLDDPAQALQALSGSFFGEHCCQGSWEGINKNGNPIKCRYKPEMVKKEYWDAKDAEQEQRKLEREQQQAQQQELLEQMQIPPQPVFEDQNLVQPLEDGTIVTPAVEPEPQPITQDIPDVAPVTWGDEYIPPEQGESDTEIDFPEYAPQEVPMAVAAKIKWSGPAGLMEAPTVGPEQMFSDTPPEEVPAEGLMGEEPTDIDGNPLEVGRSYEVTSDNTDDFVPDVYEIMKTSPEFIQFKVNAQPDVGKPWNFDDTLSMQKIKAEGIKFRPMDDANPNARGMATDEITDNDNTKGSDDPTGQTDLDTGGNSKGARVEKGSAAAAWLFENDDALSKTAGRDFSLAEQRVFVNEMGTARNLDKLDLEGTHYPDIQGYGMDSFW